MAIYYSELTVRGTDKNWVQGTFTTLQEDIASIQPQTNIIIEHKSLALFFIALGVGSLVFLILDFLIYRHIEPNQNPTGFLRLLRDFFRSNLWASYLLEFFLLWFMGMVTFARSIFNWLIELWPEIEFDFGPEHLKRHKNRRQRIWFVISLVVVPILLNVIFEFTR